MEFQTHQIKAVLVPFESLDAEGSWDPLLFLEGNSGLFGGESHRQPFSTYARVFEGDRSMSGGSGVTLSGVYRAGSIRAFEITPDAQFWAAGPQTGRASLQAGDVVLKRLAPVLVAVVVNGMPELPADGNLFIIRGLSEVDAWWITFCLNHRAFSEYLLSKSGRGVLARVSLTVLRDWRAPMTPQAFALQVRKLRDRLQHRVFLARQIAALQAEVENAVASQTESTSYEEAERCFSQASWSFWFPPSLTDPSLLPIHVASAYRSAVLHRDHDWQPLSNCTVEDPASRARFTSAEEPVMVLRLSDVTSIPLVPAAMEASVPSQPTRVFREPVQAEEVLLSTLGSNPSVAFIPSPVYPPVYPADLWERIQFRSFAAAYALILQTGAISRQLRALASGSVQQFVRSEDIRNLYLPVFPEQTLAQWDRSFRSLAKAWLQTDSEWQAALREGWLAFNRAFNLSTREDSVSNL